MRCGGADEFASAINAMNVSMALSGAERSYRLHFMVRLGALLELVYSHSNDRFSTLLIKRVVAPVEVLL